MASACGPFLCQPYSFTKRLPLIYVLFAFPQNLYNGLFFRMLETRNRAYTFQSAQGLWMFGFEIAVLFIGKRTAKFIQVQPICTKLTV
jgi:hypothetical protein